MEIEDEKLIGIFIGASVESAAQLPFIIKHKNGSEHQIISQIHNLFVFPFGTGKSVLANKIPSSLLSLSHTEPSIVGSISKEGTLVKSDLVNAAKKVYVMDECHRLNKNGMDAMLSLLEDGYYDRSLGFALRAPLKEGNYKKDGWEITSARSLNNIGLRVKFSCIGFCERITKMMQGAFLSRFAVFNVVMTDEDIFNLMRGEGVLKAGHVKEKYPLMRKPVEFNCYDDFVDEYQKLVMEKKLNFIFNMQEKGYISRIGGHLAKLTAHFCRLDGKSVVEPKHYKKALQFAPLLMRNLKESSLTPVLYNVYDAYFIRKNKQVDVAKELNVTKSYVSSSVSYLKAQGFIELTDEQKAEEEEISLEQREDEKRYADKRNEDLKRS
jgi:DNA-binding MarR family transcriptional regulator